MDRFNKPRLTPAAAPDAQPGTVRNLPALAEQHDLVTVPAPWPPGASPPAQAVAAAQRHGLGTVPAAWPTGVSALAQAVDACQRSDSEQVSTDWLARAQSNRAAAGFLPG